MKDAPYTVYLVDDDELVSVSLARLISDQGYGVSRHASAEDFLTRHDPSAPGCAIVDLRLPGMDGLGIQETLLARGGARPLIFLTGRGDIPTSVKAMKAGAVDFLTKPVEPSVLLAAIASAIERDSQERLAEVQRQSTARRFATLTPRELEVMRHVAAGRLNKQIAFELGTAEKTVKVHRSRMMKKMGVRAVADLVRLLAPLNL